MSLNIENYPNRSFQLTVLFFISTQFTVNLNRSFREKLGDEELTNAVALRIFKQIKWESDVLSFLTKPIVFIPLSVAVLVVGFALPVTAGIIVNVVALIFCFIGGSMVGISIREPSSHFLSELSQAYRNQGQRAREHIQTLEAANQEMEFVLA